MSTRSTSTDLVPPFFDPESVIRNRRGNLGDPSLLFDFEEINMANNNNNVQGPPPAGPNVLAPDLRPMEELLQAPTDGVGDAIVVPPVLAIGGNLLTQNTQEALTIIENKSKVPKKLEDPGKFLIPCVLQDLEVFNSLADYGASINLMPLSIYEKLGARPLKPT
ncbi:hypothetical protein Tco_0469745 [Tanacetum coccineum]